jgi:hypothetical protein
MLTLAGKPRAAAQGLPAPQPEPRRDPDDPNACRHCYRRVTWHEALPFAGWQTIHRCAAWTIEGYASEAGMRPWQWRTIDAS